MKKDILKKIFVSSCRVAVLDHFFKNPYGEFYGRELASMLDQHQHAVRIETKNLCDLGILSKERVGKMIYFKLENNDLSRDLAKVFGHVIFN